MEAFLASRKDLKLPDGALGFWKALDKVFRDKASVGCWFHKTANVLNKVPKSVQPAVKQDLREIWMAPDLKAAKSALDLFKTKHGAKYAAAVECLTKDRDAPLAFYSFPAKLMVFKLITAVSRTWRRLKGEDQLPKVIQGVKFRDGIKVIFPTSQSAA